MAKPSFLTRVMRSLGFVPAGGKRNFFAGAIPSRLTADWITGSTGPTNELRGSIRTLRDRARDLERNNPLVRRYLALVAENVIGHKGIRLQARNQTAQGVPNIQANTAIESAFTDWQRAESCSADGRLSWRAFQQLVIRTVARDGEAFIRKVYGPPYGFSLQLIDADLVDETYSRAAGDGIPAIKLGVEVDAWDRPLAYYCFKYHQWDVVGGSRERMRIPAEEIEHVFVPRRPGQTRGESWLAPVMLALRMLDGYAEAELVAARTAAAKMGFIVQSPDAPNGTDPDSAQQTTMDAAPGVIDRLGVGETFDSWDPTHPSQNFALFVTQITKLIAAGLNVSYAGLTSDLRETNFSSGRIGLLQERDGWRILQVWMAEHFCEPIYREWIKVAWRTGRLSLRMTPEQYNLHDWRPRGWAYVNPQQEQAADMMAVAAGFTSPQRVVADNGDDLEEIYAEIAAADTLADAYDIERYIPNSLMNEEAAANAGTQEPGDNTGGTDPSADSGSGPARGAGDGGRPHPRLALERSAGR
jgi:lambda family phage portal protein